MMMMMMMMVMMMMMMMMMMNDDDGGDDDDGDDDDDGGDDVKMFFSGWVSWVGITRKKISLLQNTYQYFCWVSEAVGTRVKILFLLMSEISLQGILSLISDDRDIYSQRIDQIH